MRACKHPPCERPVKCKGFCAGHYRRHLRGWDMDKPFRVFGDPRASFHQKVDRSGDCWLWTGAKNARGYGQQRVAGKAVLAHRLSYILHVGEIPEGMHVDHLCWTKECVNPAHLRLATNAENHQNLKGANSTSTSGVRGVSWISAKRSWRAEATLDGERHHLGYFASLEEASAVVSDWRRQHMPFSHMDRKVS